MLLRVEVDDGVKFDSYIKTIAKKVSQRISCSEIGERLHRQEGKAAEVQGTVSAAPGIRSPLLDVLYHQNRGGDWTVFNAASSDWWMLHLHLTQSLTS